MKTTIHITFFIGVLAGIVMHIYFGDNTRHYIFILIGMIIGYYFPIFKDRKKNEHKS